MSRIGNRKLVIPANIEASVDNNVLTVKSSKGTLQLAINPLTKVTIKDGIIETTVANNSDRANVMQGTTNSLINNMLIGLNEGYTEHLEIVGVGYRFNVQGNKIVVSAGYSSPVNILIPEGLKVNLDSNTEITISGIDKQKVYEFAADVRKIRQPEPYKGKGIRYKAEHVRRKVGKKAAK